MAIIIAETTAEIKVAVLPRVEATATVISVSYVMFTKFIHTRIPVRVESKLFKSFNTRPAFLSPSSFLTVIFNMEQDENAASMLDSNAEKIRSINAVNKSAAAGISVVKIKPRLVIL